MHDEPERAELALRVLAGVGAVRHAKPPAAPDRLREEQHRLAADRRGAPRALREVQSLLESLDPPTQAVGKDAVDLRERPVDRLGGARETEAPRGERPERDHDRLVVGEHERREAEAGTDAIPASDAALALDRDAEILERRDVAPRRPPVDPESLGDLTTGEERLCLEELEKLEQPGRRSQHASKSSRDRGR